MNKNTKKYGMGGAVQSFSSPMLAQGMQGGLSGFGTSGLQTFADGGQMTDIERILAKYNAMESNKPKEDETSEFLRKSWEGKNYDDYIMYSDQYKRGGKMAQGGLIEHGLQEGDKIVKEVDNKWLIVKSKSGVFSVVDIEKGSRFIVGLDDSKMSGKRTSVKAGVKQAMDYINYIKSTKMAKGGTFANGGGLDDAKIYVADLAEYNNGRLVGKWLNLSDYSSGAEVMEAIQEMLDEQTKKDKYGDVHEEYAIHDFEGFPSSFYHESMGESDFDALYDMMKVADSSNLPLEVLMEAVSDLGYEDDPERVAEAYYTSVPASMGNEWRDFAYEYIDSIGNITEAVSNPDYYFDFESFGSDVRMDYTDEELEEMGYNDLSDEELGEQMADELGGVKNLGEKLIETYFDYDKFGRELEYDFISVRGKDGDYYFFNRNFAKGGEVKNRKEVDVKNTRYRVVVTNTSSNDNRQGTYFIEASSKERAEEIALEKFKKEFGTRRGVSIYVDSIKEVPMQDGKERTRKYFVRLRNSKGSEVDDFIIDAFDETTASRRAFAMFRKKYGRPSAYNDDTEVFFSVIDRIYPIDEIRENGVTTYRRTFAKGGEVKNTIDILMTEEPKVWDKFDFNSGSEIRASKDKTKKYAQELEKVFTAKGVKKGSLTKKINEDLTDENYHLLNEFLTRNGYFNSKLTDELLKSYNNPVYSGAYADKEAMTIEEKAKPKTSGTKKIQRKKLSAKTTYIPNREIGSIELESGETLSKNDIIDGVYRAKKKFAKGGDVLGDNRVDGYKSKKLLNYDFKRIIQAPKSLNKSESSDESILGKVVSVKLPSEQKIFKTKVSAEYATMFKGSGKYSKLYDKQNIVSVFAEGGKIGFEGLAKKVAKRYVRKKVSKEYQAEYGKTYDAKEAKEVGNKVAGKVYQQQVAKKKIVRKLQRKSK